MLAKISQAATEPVNCGASLIPTPHHTSVPDWVITDHGRSSPSTLPTSNRLHNHYQRRRGWKQCRVTNPSRCGPPPKVDLRAFFRPPRLFQPTRLSPHWTWTFIYNDLGTNLRYKNALRVHCTPPSSRWLLYQFSILISTSLSEGFSAANCWVQNCTRRESCTRLAGFISACRNKNNDSLLASHWSHWSDFELGNPRPIHVAKVVKKGNITSFTSSVSTETWF